MKSTKYTSGNVLIYVLVAIVLFAALSFTLAKGMGRSGNTNQLDDDKAALKAQELIQYATTARSTIEQMRTMENVLPDEFDFVKQGETGYDDSPTTPKVYHPAGGGMNIFTPSGDLFADGSAKRGWQVQQGINVEWTPSSAADLMFTFVDVNPAVCAAINKRLFRNADIPVATTTASALFIKGDLDDVPLTKVNCEDCETKVSVCVEDSAGVYSFYNIILAQ